MSSLKQLMKDYCRKCGEVSLHNEFGCITCLTPRKTHRQVEWVGGKYSVKMKPTPIRDLEAGCANLPEAAL